MINFTLLGAGRIGKMHAKIISDHPDANLVNVYDVNQEFAKQVASDNNANIVKARFLITLFMFSLLISFKL